MFYLFKNFSLKYFKKQKVRILLTQMGIVLGVAVFIAINLVNKTVLNSFEKTIEEIAGKTDLQIYGADIGFNENILQKVKNFTGIRVASPVIQQSAILVDYKDESDLVILGVNIVEDNELRDYKIEDNENGIDPLDLLAQPDTILISKRFALRHNLKIDDKLRLYTVSGIKEFFIKGILLPKGPAKVLNGNLGVMDIYAAQIVFDKINKFDRIDIGVNKTYSVDNVSEELKRELPPGLKIDRPKRRNSQVEKLLFSFRMGLSLTSLVAIFVSMFLIYNTISMNIFQRQKEIGILRCLGLTSREVQNIFIFESFILGFFASLIGVFVGLLISKGVLTVVVNAVSVNFLKVEAQKVILYPFTFIISILLGSFASIIAGYLSSRKAAKICPYEAISKTNLIDYKTEKQEKKYYLFTGWILLILSFLLIYSGTKIPNISYLSVVLLFVGFSFLAGHFTFFILKNIKMFTSKVFGWENQFVISNINRERKQTVITIIALMISICQTIAIASLIISYKRSVTDWFDKSINANIFINSSKSFATHFDYPLPYDIKDKVKDIPCIEDIYGYKMIDSEYKNLPYKLCVTDLSPYLKHAKLTVLKGDQKSIDDLLNDKGVFISESFAEKFKMNIGDLITFATPKGLLSLKILAVYLNYTSDLGVVLFDRNIFVKYWLDTNVDSFGVYVKPGTDLNNLKSEISSRLSSQYRINILTNDEFRNEILNMIEQMFSLNYAVEFIAILIAVFGIINILIISIINRQREIGIIRVLGGSKGSIKKMVFMEAGIIAVIANILGIVLGFLYSFVLTKAITKESFGWTLQYFYPFQSTVKIFCLTLSAGILAAWYPAKKAIEVPVNEIIGYE